MDKISSDEVARPQGEDHWFTTQSEQNNAQAVRENSNTLPRKRVSKACDRCRSRKDKCDGARPACLACANLHLTCSYDTNTKKRGLPEGYVRAVEKLWALTIRKVHGVEESVVSI